MSSIEFAIQLRANGVLRKLVLGSGTLLSAVGVLLIVGWPIDFLWRVLSSLLWLTFSALEIRSFRRAYMIFSHIRIDALGNVTLTQDPHGNVSAELLPGSVLLKRVGWLRLKSKNGHKFAELIAGNSRKNKDWRRLQLIWRHL